MLLLGSRTITVEGVTVFPDHADPDQFWYLPAPVQLGDLPSGEKAFTFIKYRPAAVTGGAKGGGFLMFQCDLRLDKDLERRILGKLGSIAKDRPRLTVVPFDEGTVQCIALNVQGSGGTLAQPAGPGSFNAVEKILGSSVPSLQGDNTAAFSLTLSQEGATIVEKAFAQGTAPVGVIYNLKFTGMRPALHVKITADLERVYDQLGGSIEATVYFVKAGIDAAFEKMHQDGVIHIEVLNFTGDEDEKEKERWALDFFKENLLRSWFEPTLAPGQVAAGQLQTPPVTMGNTLRPPTTPTPPSPPGIPTPSTIPMAGGLPTRPPTGATGTPTPNVGFRPPPPPPAGNPAGTPPTQATGFPLPTRPAPTAAATPINPPSVPATMPPAGISSPPAGGGAPALVSFKLRVVHQEERKQIKVVYDRSEATQRTYAPQGFFGLMVADLDRSKHFVDVDLDDPFFRVFSVSVEPPLDSASIGLRSTHVTLDYGNPSEPATLKHKDFVLDKDNTEPEKFEVFLNSALDLSYRTSVQYHFDPGSGWDGPTFEVPMPEKVTEDRTLLLNPHEIIGFLEVEVTASKVDWEVVESIDVFLRHTSGGAVMDKQLLLTAASPGPVNWKTRTADKDSRDYTYRWVCHLNDGSTREFVGPEPSRSALLPVDDPFPGALNLIINPALDETKTRTAFVDVEYHDESNDYRRELQIEITPQDVNRIRKSFAVINPKHKKFSYTLTFLGNDGSITRLPSVDSENPYISVQEQPA
ncbi:hypothetical protein [Rhodococcus koreensis]